MKKIRIIFLCIILTIRIFGQTCTNCEIGNDSLGISTIDTAGIALSGIQELAKQNKKLEKENAELKAHLEELAAALLVQKATQARSEKKIEYLNKRFELLTEIVVSSQK